MLMFMHQTTDIFYGVYFLGFGGFFFLSAVANKLCASGKATAARGFVGPSRRQEAFDRHLNELRQLIMDKIIVIRIFLK